MRFHGNGVVWDGERNKALCEFVHGELVTDDERAITRLKDLGYPHDPEPKPPVEEGVEKPRKRSK